MNPAHHFGNALAYKLSLKSMPLFLQKSQAISLQNATNTKANKLPKPMCIAVSQLFHFTGANRLLPHDKGVMASYSIFQ